jgi:hypothetical protein
MKGMNAATNDEVQPGHVIFRLIYYFHDSPS